MTEGTQGKVPSGNWAAQQLNQMLSGLKSFADEDGGTERLVERAAEALGADAAAVVEGSRVITVAGKSVDRITIDSLRNVALDRPDVIELAGSDQAHACSVPAGEDADRSLVIIRRASPFESAETDLLEGLGRVIALGRETSRLIDNERDMRATSENHAAENDRLLDALRGRQVLLEKLATIQRAIVAQKPLHDVYDQVVQAASELLSDPVAMIRMTDFDGGGRSTVAASVGMSDAHYGDARRSEDPGLGARAMAEGRLIVVDKNTDPLVQHLPGLWRREGLYAGMAAPLLRGSTVVGSVGVASSDPNRAYTARDQQALLALAEHTSLALNQARALEDVAHEAFHDSLTGLPNRLLFLDRLDHAVSRATRSGDYVGVLFIDVDDFKHVNDSLGHQIGDELLRAVSSRLSACLRPSDTIARLGGDDFAVLLEEIDDTAEAATAASRLLDSLSDPITIEGREIYVNASVGIAAGNDDAQTLLRDADLAMYRAKAEGKGRYRAYAPHMHDEMVERMELEVDLKRAIENDELELRYQPIFHLRSGTVAGLEALVRWNHPTRGLLRPDSFIPLAESSGRIHELGRWVLAEACHQAALWRARYPANEGLKVGVNLSGLQLQDDGIVDQVSDALRRAQLAPEGLTLEVTETALMEDLDAGVRRLSELKSLGVDIAVDDFGVGHSSLVYLKRLPLDNLKIAKPFVDEIANPEADPPILRAVLELAEVFGLRSVAEGIERPEQAEHLSEQGCEMGQGHLLSMPLTAEEADDLILNVGLLGSPTSRPAPPADEGETADAVRRSGSPDGPAAAS